MINNAITITGLQHAFDGNLILDEVNTSFQQDKFSVLLGKNGSGKSTFFNLISGLIPYRSGSISYFGKELRTMRYAKRAQLLGFLPQQHKPVFPFSVFDVLLTGRAAHSFLKPSATDIACVERVLQELEIENLKYKAYTDLSGGQQQLVMIGRILVQNPRVIILDEPTNHLDIYHQTHLMAVLKNLSRQGYTILAIMHDPNLAFLHADDIFFMQHKKIINQINIFDDEENTFLKSIYNVDMDTLNYRGKKMVVPRM